jgi:hypothetical protein
MIAKTGSVVTWHWAHRVLNPDCTIAPESEWHLAWKALGLDGSQEIVVGSRRADVLAPGGFAVEFQASPLTGEEVRDREADWAAQGGMAWVFRADKEFAAGRIGVTEYFRPEWKDLLREENRTMLKVTWSRAPERVRAARALSLLDIGDGQLLFIGAWGHWGSYVADYGWSGSPLAGYGWRVPRSWVVENVLHGTVMPVPLAESPSETWRRIEAWERGEHGRKQKEHERHFGTGRWRAQFLAEHQRQLEDDLKAGQATPEGSLRAVWAEELWPLRNDLEAVRAIWAEAVKTCEGRLPAAAAIRRARQEYEQEHVERERED